MILNWYWNCSRIWRQPSKMYFLYPEEINRKPSTKRIRWLYLRPIANNSFEQFTVPFPLIEKLFIDMLSDFAKFKPPVMPSDQLFSNIRQPNLELQSSAIVFYLIIVFFDCELPHLEKSWNYQFQKIHFPKLLYPT